MILHVNPSRVSGKISVPGSKSHTIRAIVAALLADGACAVRSPLKSADTLSTLRAAEKLGAKVEELDGLWNIAGTGGKLRDPGCTLDLGNSGTGLRLLSAAAATAGFPVSFDGDASLRTRPMRQLAEALKQLGAEVDSNHCPLTVKGPLTGGFATVEAVSSQFLSALLFALPQARHLSTLEITVLNEVPYVGITLDWLDRCGINHAETADYSNFIIPAHQKFLPFDAVIPADFSTACFPLAAAAVTGGEIEIANLNFNDPQGDKLVFAMFEAMGCNLEREAGGTTIVHGSSHMHGETLDLNATPDALPILAASACFSGGVTRLVNAPQARIKETDRIACMTAELRKMGADIEELPDGMIIRGGRLKGARLDSHDDHRIAMSLAIAALAADTPSEIGNIEAADVTYPDFVKDFQALGADFTVAE